MQHLDISSVKLRTSIKFKPTSTLFSSCVDLILIATSMQWMQDFIDYDQSSHPITLHAIGYLIADDAYYVSIFILIYNRWPIECKFIKFKVSSSTCEILSCNCTLCIKWTYVLVLLHYWLRSLYSTFMHVLLVF